MPFAAGSADVQPERAGVLGRSASRAAGRVERRSLSLVRAAQPDAARGQRVAALSGSRDVRGAISERRTQVSRVADAVGLFQPHVGRRCRRALRVLQRAAAGWPARARGSESEAAVRHYSYLSAKTGFTRVARSAGM